MFASGRLLRSYDTGTRQGTCNSKAQVQIILLKEKEH